MRLFILIALSVRRRKQMISVAIDGIAQQATSGERLIDVINRAGAKLPQVCYHPQLGPIETCDACMVEIDGRLARACATTVSDGLVARTTSEKASAAQRQAFHRILSNHLPYCTVCDL